MKEIKTTKEVLAELKEMRQLLWTLKPSEEQSRKLGEYVRAYAAKSVQDAIERWEEVYAPIKKKVEHNLVLTAKYGLVASLVFEQIRSGHSTYDEIFRWMGTIRRDEFDEAVAKLLDANLIIARINDEGDENEYEIQPEIEEE